MEEKWKLGSEITFKLFSRRASNFAHESTSEQKINKLILNVISNTSSQAKLMSF